jgi:hypothetical protein
MQYHHTQFATLIVVSVLALIIIIFFISLTDETVRAPMAVAIPILTVFLALFYSLQVEIYSGMLSCRFGIGLIHRTIPLSSIQEARVVRNPWYVGWGIRWMPGQYWLWNVSGLSAVELLLKNGSRFRIGTNEPETLLRALEANMVSVASTSAVR